ncbi:MAG: hypothetical protein JWR80_520 [Bradyrhizobium sp.]|nr:hypothetical protein [Bradyrhizobium sp.]
MNDLANPLSAASLLLTVLALLYGAWSASIQAAIDDTLPTASMARDAAKKAIRRLRNRRALPLALGGWLILIAFVPRDLDIQATSAACMGDPECHYDDVATVFLLTQLFMLGMAIHLTSQVFALGKQAR